MLIFELIEIVLFGFFKSCLGIEVLRTMITPDSIYFMTEWTKLISLFYFSFKRSGQNEYKLFSTSGDIVLSPEIKSQN